MKSALLLVDIQNDYFPGGKMELAGADAAGNKVTDLIAFARNASIETVHVQHVSVRPGATFFIPDTEGVEINSCAKPEAGEKIFIKNYPNSFRQTGLDDYLKSRNIGKLIIAGMMTHMCIDTTVRAAFDLGYEITLVHDCCATRNLKFGDHEVSSAQVHLSFISALNGTFARALSCRETMDETDRPD